jgi:hypothetical protein
MSFNIGHIVVVPVVWRFSLVRLVGGRFPRNRRGSYFIRVAVVVGGRCPESFAVLAGDSIRRFGVGVGAFRSVVSVVRSCINTIYATPFPVIGQMTYLPEIRSSPTGRFGGDVIYIGQNSTRNSTQFKRNKPRNRANAPNAVRIDLRRVHGTIPPKRQKHRGDIKSGVFHCNRPIFRLTIIIRQRADFDVVRHVMVS